MKKLITICNLVMVFLASGNLGAKGVKPILTDIKFLVSGKSVETTSFGDVTVELQFDKAMDQTVIPVVKFGLTQPLELTVPEGQGWISNTLWQGFFTVSDNNPQTGDGKYKFKIYGAEDANNVEMDTTLSSDLNKYLYICRSGDLELTTLNLDFGKVKAGSSKTLSVTINNNSCADLVVSNITIPAPFALINSPSNFTIPGNNSKILTIYFKSNSRRSYSETMTIYSNDRAQSTHSVQLIAKTHGPKIVLAPGSVLSFGKVEAGSSSSQTVLVTNTSAEDASLSDTLRVTNISSNGSIYTVSASKLTIPPDSTQRIEVTFKPVDYTLYNGYILSFNSDDSTQPLRTIRLDGDARDETPPPPLANVTVSNWSNYQGFINAQNLAICWENPSDPSGIAEIWWKFTTSPTPPQFATDTTRAGGRIILANGSTCANLALFGKLYTSGLWYSYFWLVDSSGNSGWANPYLQSFIYDITPPGVPSLLGRTVPELQWFGENTAFKLTIGIPVDPFRRTKDAAEVRWKFKSPPSSATDYVDGGRYIFQSPNPESVTFTIPFNSTSLCGDDSLYYWLADSAGNVSADSFAIARYRFDICSPQITRIASDTQNVAILAQTFLDTVLITDDVGVDSARVRYRFGGAESEEPARKLTRMAKSDSFVVDIPRAGVTRRGLEYKIVAIDSLENQGEGPHEITFCNADSVWFPVRTRVEGEGDFRIDSDGRPVPLLAGEEETNYQLFSVPYNLDSSSIMQVLQDDLGPYDSTVWRLFDYKTDNPPPDSTRFLEGANARPFTPGRSYFIITRQENIVVDSGPGVTRRTICNDTLQVFEGWNLIATPFNFPVAKESLSLINSNSLITLRSYERGWNITDVMEPWKGYALYVTRASDLSRDTQIYLVVKPKAAPGRLSKTTSGYPTLQPGDWLIQVSAQAGQMHDNSNWVGIQHLARAGFDELELAEPPVIGKYIRVALSHPEWKQPVEEFSTDIRPFGMNEQVWEFMVFTNLPLTLVSLNFDFLGDFPRDVEVHLIDDALKLAQNLRSNSVYAFKSGKQGSKKTLRLIVGNHQFSSSQAGDIGLIPEKFELLQNYPNPFNPQTAIRYNLSEATPVKLIVYDLLGKQVRALIINEKQNAGYYIINWDGRDDAGGQVASGVYIYRISTNAHSTAKKMILMK